MKVPVRSPLGLVLAATVWLAGCVQPLDPASIVRTPRILAIVVEPPEAHPGQDVAVRAMVSVPEEVPRPLRLRWRSCIDPERLLVATGIRVDLGRDRPCDEAVLAEDEPYLVAGERTQAAIEELRGLAGLGGFDRRFLDRLIETAGLAYVIDLEVLDASDGVLVAGYKRAAVTTRERPTTNPPPPTFRFGETVVVATDAPFQCAAIDGAVPRARTDTDIELAPILPEGAEEEPWLERFPIFDYTGGLVEGRENAYYSWFATDGRFSVETSRPPDRQTRWRTPARPGRQALWLVVRDGHLGASACRLEVDIE
jgi:hypothetical protein